MGKKVELEKLEIKHGGIVKMDLLIKKIFFLILAEKIMLKVMLKVFLNDPFFYFFFKKYFFYF
jgi:hypothetical protein